MNGKRSGQVDYSEQKYYDRAVLYGRTVRGHTFQHKLWLIYVGLMETADMVRF